MGVPGEGRDGFTSAGQVNILYGTGNGLSGTGDQVWHQGSTGILGAPEDGDQFGEVLAVGDFDGDGFDDLAVGVPNEDVDGATESGVVNVLHGTDNGLSAAGNQVWHQNRPGIHGARQDDDHFGYALAAGDLDGDGSDDLAVGVPVEDRFGFIDSEQVQVLYGTDNGLSAAGDQLWYQNSSGILGEVEDFDRFGWALAAGDFDGDGSDDLAVGVPRENVTGVPFAGAVNVLYGAP